MMNAPLSQVMNAPLSQVMNAPYVASDECAFQLQVMNTPYRE